MLGARGGRRPAEIIIRESTRLPYARRNELEEVLTKGSNFADAFMKLDAPERRKQLFWRLFDAFNGTIRLSQRQRRIKRPT